MKKEVLQVTHAVSERLASEGAEAVAVFGSQVREDAYKESDIDVHAIGKGPSYRLERFQGFLVSISWATSRRHQRAFKDPGEVGGIVPAWRNALIIHDPKGIAEELKEKALEWRWASLGNRADRWVAEELTGWPRKFTVDWKPAVQAQKRGVSPAVSASHLHGESALCSPSDSV